MDDAFLPLPQMLGELTAMPGEIHDADAGVRSYISAFEIESPIELDLYRDEAGKLCMGSVPPLYRVDTSFRPSYHHIRLVAECDRSDSREDSYD